MHAQQPIKPPGTIFQTCSGVIVTNLAWRLGDSLLTGRQRADKLAFIADLCEFVKCHLLFIPPSFSLLGFESHREKKSLISRKGNHYYISFLLPYPLNDLFLSSQSTYYWSITLTTPQLLHNKSCIAYDEIIAVGCQPAMISSKAFDETTDW